MDRALQLWVTTGALSANAGAPLSEPAPTASARDLLAPPAFPSGGASAPASARHRPAARISYRMLLVVSIGALVLLTGVTLTAVAFRSFHATTTVLSDRVFHSVSDHAVTQTRDFVLRAVPIVQSLGNFAHLGLALDDPDQLARQLASVLRGNPKVSWISYSDEAGGFVGVYVTPAGTMRVNQSRIVDGRTRLVEHNILADGNWELHRRDDDSGYDPRTRPFYVRAREAGKTVWLPPYIFYEQGVPGITCANPLYDRAGRLQGVFTADFDLNVLSDFIGQLAVSPNSHLFLLTPDGVLLAHPGQRLTFRPGNRDRGQLPTVQGDADPLLQAFFQQLRPEDRVAPFGSDSARQFQFQHAGTPYFARATAFYIDDGLTWIVGAVAPTSDFLADVQRSNTVLLAASLGALVVALILATALARRVSGPIVSLVSFMRTVGDGDLTRRADLRGAREFGLLSEALNHMIADLRDRLRMRAALSVAMEVQQKLLPAEPPRLPGLDIAGFSAYCEETGGDYFDYLTLDDGAPQNPAGGPRAVLVAIGDVSGHGIGSALLMAGARAVLRSRAACIGGDVAELMTHLNELLVADMMGARFMTMLLCLIDPAARTIACANAGHDPALIYDPRTDRFEPTARGELPLGVEPGVRYECHTAGPLRPGQIVVLGTDGIWEFPNPGGEFYGKERLMDVIRAAATHSAEEITAAVSRDLNAFRAGARQRDDVTLVIIKVLPQQ